MKYCSTFGNFVHCCHFVLFVCVDFSATEIDRHCVSILASNPAYIFYGVILKLQPTTFKIDIKLEEKKQQNRNINFIKNGPIFNVQVQNFFLIPRENSCQVNHKIRPSQVKSPGYLLVSTPTPATCHEMHFPRFPLWLALCRDRGFVQAKLADTLCMFIIGTLMIKLAGFKL